jgi:hypothetical protein
MNGESDDLISDIFRIAKAFFHICKSGIPVIRSGLFDFTQIDLGSELDLDKQTVGLPGSAEQDKSLQVAAARCWFLPGITPCRCAFKPFYSPICKLEYQ